MKVRPSIIIESLHRLKSHLWENDLAQKFADGAECKENFIRLNDDHQEHMAEVIIYRGNV